MARFRISFQVPPAANPADVAVRKLEVLVGGVLRDTVALDPAATATPPLEFAESDFVIARLVDADAAGNEARGAALEFTVIDDVPPAAPGALAIASKEQIDVVPPPA